MPRLSSAFANRRCRYEARAQINRRRIYDTLRINFFEATKQTACIFSKGNGDGLLDYQQAGVAKLNIGDEFTTAGAWQAESISKGSVNSGGGNFGLGLNIGPLASYGGGNN